MGLKDKVIVITGSTKGIGKSIAEACGKRGARLVICARNQADVTKVCSEFKHKGYQVAGIQVDVTKLEDLQKLFDHSLETWGEINIWINNAGVSSGFKPLDKMTVEDVTATVNTNLTATLQACRLAISYFKDNGGGVILNMSGRGGRGDAAPFMTPYAATKAAVTELTKCLAEENKGLPLSIHTISPGMVDTDLVQNSDSSLETEEILKSLPYIMKAIGVPVNVVGEFCADVADQEPGKVTGKNYSLLKGSRLMRGISMMLWYRISGKI